MTKTIIMGRKVPVKVLVDDEDYGHLSGFRWGLAAGYASRRIYLTGNETRRYRVVYMHREIMQAERGQQVDHINRNKLDNRRSNLRLCTVHQNKYNLPPQRVRNGIPVSSRYKGVHLAHPSVGVKSRPWVASITADGQYKHLGYFATEEEAALAYDSAAVELHGEFSLTNADYTLIEEMTMTPGERWLLDYEEQHEVFEGTE